MTETTLGWKCPRCLQPRAFSQLECPDDGVKLAFGFDPATLLGARLKDSLLLTGHLGSGGFGHVFLATHTETHGARVVKLLRPEYASDAATLGRFQREARVAESLEHRAIVRVYDTGSVEGVPYIVMERVRGESLRAILTRDGSLPPARVATIVEQVADALMFAHERDVIHRDLTPGNIMVRQGPSGGDEVTVIDFGLARPMGPTSGSALTSRRETVGTAAYMSPEQLGLGTVDYRTDIFALAMLAIEMLAGALPPRVGDELPDANLEDPYGIGELPAAQGWSSLRQVLSRGAHPAKRERYQTARDFAADLSRALGFASLAGGTSAPSVTATAAATAAGSSSTARAREGGTATPRSERTAADDTAPRTNVRRSTFAAAIVAIAAVVVLVVWLKGRTTVPGDLDVDLQASASAPPPEVKASPRAPASQPVATNPVQKKPVDEPERPSVSAEIEQELGEIDQMSRGSVPLAFRAIGRAERLMPRLTTFDDSVRLRLITVQASLSAGRPQVACTDLRALEVTTEATRWQQQVASVMNQVCR